VLAVAGLAAAALAYAGWSLHAGLAEASEAAVRRLTETVARTVELRWEALRASETPPLEVAGEFRWTTTEERLRLEPAAVEPAGRSVLLTLLDEAERLEVVEGDLAGALARVQEALAKDPESPLAARAIVRELQLAQALGQADVVEASLARLAEVPAADCGGIPCRIVAALALPAEGRAFLGAEELERAFLADDRLVFEEGEVRFEPAPLLVETCARLGEPLPPFERRAVLALEWAQGFLPDVRDDRTWHVFELLGRPFLARHDPGRVRGFFFTRAALATALAADGLPTGFALDLEGDREELGTTLGEATPLADSPFAFTLRHADPTQLAVGEARRRGLLRFAFFGLALACLAGGVATARLLARERQLAALRTGFIAGVSHDLRTPLAAILLLCENLESGVADAAGRGRYLAALRREAGRLRRLVDDVLDFARLERGEGPKLVREELELAPFVATLAEELGERVRASGRPFVHEAGGLTELGALDGHAVRRALENLVDNALKHGAGAVTLVSAVRDGALELALADEGRGIAPEARERVFEPFERLGADGHVGGTGLGLAIVRAIARAHGGDARVGSSASGGARFELRLPLVEPEA